MKTYKVRIEYFQTINVEVEADDKERAEEIALESADYQLSPDVTVTLIKEDPNSIEEDAPETISDEYEMGLHNQDPMEGQISLLEVAS